MLEKVRDLPKSTLLVTSRSNYSTRIEFLDFPSTEIMAIEDDLVKYNRRRIPKEPRLKIYIPTNPTLLDVIERSVMVKVQGI